MKFERSGRLLLSWALVLPMTAIAFASGANGAPALGVPTQVTQKAPELPDIKIVISLTKDTFEVGEPIPVSIVVSSPAGRETLPAWGDSHEADFVPIVVGWDRMDPPLTSQGRKWTQRAFREATGEEEFSAEPRTYVVDLTEYFDLGEGGTFDLSISRRITKADAYPRYVESQKVRLQVGAARPDGEAFRLRRTKSPLQAYEIDRWGPEKCGLQLAVRLRNEVIRAGEEVIVDVYIRNRSDEAINLIWNSSYWYSFDIRDAEGRPIDESSALLDLPTEGGPMNRNLIAPGGCLVGYIRPPSRYSFDKPGRYTISVSRDVSRQCGADWLLETEKLELEVR